MMKVLCGAVLSALLLAAGQVGAACQSARLGAV